MSALIGGIVAMVLGLIGLIVWWEHFIQALLAIIPLMLIVGGALATYLGIEEWKDTTSQTENFGAAPSDGSGESGEAEKYKAEAEKYKSELDSIKKAEADEGEASEPEVPEDEG